MTRPQKCKRGLKPSQIGPYLTLKSHDPTAEMQKGIETEEALPYGMTPPRDDPTAEMQKGTTLRELIVNS